MNWCPFCKKKREVVAEIPDDGWMCVLGHENYPDYAPRKDGGFRIDVQGEFPLLKESEEKTRADAPRYTGSAPAHEAGPSHEGPVIRLPSSSPGS